MLKFKIIFNFDQTFSQKNMSPRTAEQFEKIRIDRKKAILDAALHVFAEEGYHSASISKVSKKAGVSKGLMYNYFESKEDLLHQLLGDIILKETRIMEFLGQDEFNDDTIIALLNHTAELLKQDPKHWKLYFLMSVQPDVMEILMEDHKEIQGQFYAKYVEYFQKKGFENPMLTLQYFGATWGGIKMSFIMDPDNFPIDDMKTLVINQFIKQ